MRTQRPLIWAASAAMAMASCGGSSTVGATSSTTNVSSESTDVGSVLARIEAIEMAVAIWRPATSIEDAQVAAETAANLIVGPNGPGFGDRNGDGVVDGKSAVGVIPGLDGTPVGLANSLSDNGCVKRDVLGGAWTDPGAQWAAMLSAIETWRLDNNTMPTLASHPMRIVGWATFSLASESLDEIHEYGGHASLDVDITRRALHC